MGVFPMERDAAQVDCRTGRVAADAWPGGWPQDARGFRELVEIYLERLVRYASRRLGNVHDAEDVVQDVLVRAFAGRSRQSAVAQVGAYLYRMTANGCTDVMRRRVREAPRAATVYASGKDERVASMNPGDAARAAEEAQRTEQLLRRLPTAQAEAVRLRVFGDLSLSEIAEVTGCSVNTVNSRLRYGFRKLRRIVAKEWTS